MRKGPFKATMQVEYAGAVSDGAERIIRVPMRDGVALVTSLWLPDGEGPAPLVLVRTPYDRTATAPLVHRYGIVEAGYALAIQDARGTGDSDGVPSFFFDEGPDGYDTVEWLAAQPWCTGRVGMMGGSYLATAQWLAAREHPSHLVCIAPTSPAGRLPDEVPYIGGALMPRYTTFFSGLEMEPEALAQLLIDHRPLADLENVVGRPLPMLAEFLAHPTLDEYWQRVRLTPTDYAALDIPSLMCAGWFDEDLIGTTEYWAGLEAHGPEHDRHLVIGPWTHGLFSEIAPTLGELSFGDHSVVDLPRLHRDFFDRYLRQHDGLDVSEFAHPRARIFVTGVDEWRDLAVYPPRETAPHRLYLHSGGSANTRHGDGRLDDTPPDDEPVDHFTFDPENPVQPATHEERHAFARGVDQSALEERQDVLVYTTDELERPIEAIGPAFVELQAITDGPDTDFTARLLDVRPDGRALLLGSWTVGGIIRARYRKGGPEEELLIPGEPYAYRIDLHHIGHRFLIGHRVRLEISSSFAPLFRPNPNTGNPIAIDTELRVARQQILHRAGSASALVLPVMPID